MPVQLLYKANELAFQFISQSVSTC